MPPCRRCEQEGSRSREKVPPIEGARIVSLPEESASEARRTDVGDEPLEVHSLYIVERAAVNLELLGACAK